jgi:antitoxin component of RelBE/YafQ-DinJ toxin-antitoxin module
MIEIVVLGTGENIMFVQRAREALAKMGMQLDIQDTVRFIMTELIFRKMLPVCLIFCKPREGVLLRH